MRGLTPTSLVFLSIVLTIMAQTPRRLMRLDKEKEKVYWWYLNS
jgi:hypothetical protein